MIVLIFNNSYNYCIKTENISGTLWFSIENEVEIMFQLIHLQYRWKQVKWLHDDNTYLQVGTSCSPEALRSHNHFRRTKGEALLRKKNET